MTLGELIASGARQLEQAGVAFGHGTTNAHDEAAWLVLWRLGLPLDSDLDSMKNQPVAPASQAQVATLLKNASPPASPPPTSRARPGCKACPSTWTNAPSCRAASSPN